MNHYAKRFQAYRAHEVDAQVAEYRLSTEGIKPELLLYLAAIGEVYR